MNQPSVYSIGGSLQLNAPTYVWRSADDELYEQLMAGRFCYVLTSRQMGKSSLRVRTMARLQAADVACAFIDLTASGSIATPDQWYRGLLYRIFRMFPQVSAASWETEWTNHSTLPVVQRFGHLLETVLLPSLQQNIVIFIDEIEAVLSFEFRTDDFFAFIRACYNQRAENPIYRRLTFCLLGVTTPSDLIENRRLTPFNIGQAIQLNGLELQHARTKLTQGMAGKVNNPEQSLKEILAWTGGQPFLTQKICQLVGQHAEGHSSSLEDIIHRYIIKNWETQDDPEHLKTIRDRILYNPSQAIALLYRYQTILNSSVTVSNEPEDIELQLSGLVTCQNNRLIVANRVYQTIFNQHWIERQLDNIWEISNPADTFTQRDAASITKQYTIKLFTFNLVLITVATLSLYLHYGVFLGESRTQEFINCQDCLNNPGLVELFRLLILLSGASYMMDLRWKDQADDLRQSKSKKAKFFRWAILAIFICLFAALAWHNFFNAPQYLQAKYPSIDQQLNDPFDRFKEYQLPSIVYIAYGFIVYVPIALKFTVISVYAVTNDLTKNWQNNTKLKSNIAKVINTYSTIPNRLKQKTVRNLFAQYFLVFINIISPYTTLFIWVEAIRIFEDRVGLMTYTPDAQSFQKITYFFSASVLGILFVSLSQYLKALKTSSDALLRLQDENTSKFRTDNGLFQLLGRLIGSNVSFLLLFLIVLSNFLNVIVEKIAQAFSVL
ncbi:AAA-like domain-containing protein [Leptothoe kymatousa]|uniref:AAA-like domain-containing protein n=1 Tax=Leptothoe kymatousa TAU-MAC 1615 TaxID=2364775 RepID=A0ABS5XZU8_9CYAN|nr:AAA-like domain-containing protein [Leptothoe kymatousa]MBT9311096.1 AAA-like domain-containing protein [Leptothoe kymatousa TAU-MAC 1615]